MFLPDINFWLALAFERHFHHQLAKKWFDTAAEGSCAFCRITQQGFLRLATNPKVMREDAVSMERAWQLYDAFLSDPRVTFAEERAALEPFWREYTQAYTFSPKVWNDAYLAAFARAYDWHLLTFDRALAGYPHLRTLILS